MRIVAVDDYQGLALEMGLAERLAGAGSDDIELVVLREHLGVEALVAELAGASVVVAMRERTRFDRALFARLPDLRLLVTTGRANAAIDLATADVISVHLVLSDRTRHLIGEPELRAMRPSAILVNTSRGPIIDPSALRRALAEGWISGAGLDVYDVEPLPAGDPMRTAPRTVLTPHIGFVTERTMDYWYDEIAEDIAAWRRGAPLRVISGEGGRL